jgi:anti-sigma factor RsiW
MPRPKNPMAQAHTHSKAGCLKVLRRLSAYLDDELTTEVCKEVRAHMGLCPRCELFLDSLRQTIALCRHCEAGPLSPSKKLQLRREIQKAISRA